MKFNFMIYKYLVIAKFNFILKLTNKNFLCTKKFDRKNLFYIIITFRTFLYLIRCNYLYKQKRINNIIFINRHVKQVSFSKT
jgi:hypothetical protein